MGQHESKKRGGGGSGGGVKILSSVSEASLIPASNDLVSRAIRANIMNDFRGNAYNETELQPEQLKERVKESNNLNLLKSYLDSRDIQRMITASQVITSLCDDHDADAYVRQILSWSNSIFQLDETMKNIFRKSLFEWTPEHHHQVIMLLSALAALSFYDLQNKMNDPKLSVIFASSEFTKACTHLLTRCFGLPQVVAAAKGLMLSIAYDKEKKYVLFEPRTEAALKNIIKHHHNRNVRATCALLLGQFAVRCHGEENTKFRFEHALHQFFRKNQERVKLMLRPFHLEPLLDSNLPYCVLLAAWFFSYSSVRTDANYAQVVNKAADKFMHLAFRSEWNDLVIMALKSMDKYEELLKSQEAGEFKPHQQSRLQTTEKFTHNGIITKIMEYQNVVYSSSADKTLCAWDKNTGDLLCCYEGHIDAVTCFDIVDDKIYSVSLDETIRIWSTYNNNNNKNNNNKISVSPSSPSPTSSSTSSSPPPPTSSGNKSEPPQIFTSEVIINSIQFRRGLSAIAVHNGTIYVAGADRVITAFDMKTNKSTLLHYTPDGKKGSHNSKITTLSVAKFDVGIVLSRDTDNDSDSSRSRSSESCPTSNTPTTTTTTTSSTTQKTTSTTDPSGGSGTFLFSGSADSAVRIWNLKTNTCARTFVNEGYVWNVVASTSSGTSSGSGDKIKKINNNIVHAHGGQVLTGKDNRGNLLYSLRADAFAYSARNSRLFVYNRQTATIDSYRVSSNGQLEAVERWQQPHVVSTMYAADDSLYVNSNYNTISRIPYKADGSSPDAKPFAVDKQHQQHQQQLANSKQQDIDNLIHLEISFRGRRNQDAGRSGEKPNNNSKASNTTVYYSPSEMQLPFRDRVSLFRTRLRRDLGYLGEDSPAPLYIKKESLLACTFKALENVTTLRTRPLFISFLGEDTLDVDVYPQLFALAAEAIVDPSNGLFAQTGVNRTAFPAPAINVSKKQIEYFRYIGRFVAKCILDKVYTNLNFSLPFYKIILGKPLTFHDLEKIDPFLYNMFKSMLLLLVHNGDSATDACDDNDNDNNDDDDDDDQLQLMGLDFTAEVLQGGAGGGGGLALDTVNLKENGESIRVTRANAVEYVTLYSIWRMQESVRPQVESFLEGFYEVVPQEYLALFRSENELEELLLCPLHINNADEDHQCPGYEAAVLNNKNSNNNEDNGGSDTTVVSFNELRKSAAVVPSLSSSSSVSSSVSDEQEKKLVAAFWDLWQRDFANNNTAKIRLLQYVCGTSCMAFYPTTPTGNYARMEPPFTIQINPFLSTTSPPLSNICYNRLELPCYESYDKLLEKMKAVLQLQ